MSDQLLRLEKVRAPHAPRDDVSAGDVADGLATTEAEFQNLVLSQLRRILFGVGPGRWNDDFVAHGLSPLAAIQRGRVLPSAFSGTPKTSQIFLPRAFSSADYSVAATVLTSRDVQYAISVRDQSTTGFVLELGTGDLGGIVAAHWVAVGG